MEELYLYNTKNCSVPLQFIDVRSQHKHLVSTLYLKKYILAQISTTIGLYYFSYFSHCEKIFIRWEPIFIGLINPRKELATLVVIVIDHRQLKIQRSKTDNFKCYDATPHKCYHTMYSQIYPPLLCSHVYQKVTFFCLFIENFI